MNEYLSGVLEDCAIIKIIADIEYAYVQSKVRLIQDFADPVQANVILCAVHGNMRVRAVACAIENFLDINHQNQNELSRAWFNICLWPALEDSHREKI